MAYDIAADVRLDPRLKAILAGIPLEAGRDVDSRETLLAEENSEEARKQAELFRSFMDLCDTEEAAPSAGLRVHTEKVISAPDGNTINLQVIRPDNDETVACVYYIHGGGMASLSCYDGMYRGWGKIIAANGVAVVMVDFRNSLTPSSVPEVAPFPAGLNDCVSGLRWVVANAERLGIDPSRVIVAGDSADAHAIHAADHRLVATEDGAHHIVEQAHVLPVLAWGPGINLCILARVATSAEGLRPRSREYDSNRGAIGYGIEAFTERNPLAWPSFATPADVEGFPPTVISVNECDPLRDEGINFYRLLLSAGIPARCRQVMGTMHATEIITIACPDISRDTARDLAAFGKG